MNAATKFFYDHAGWSHRADEDPDEGRRQGARLLAGAEAWARRQGLDVLWEDDPFSDHSYLEQPEFDGYEVETCEIAWLTEDRSNSLASLGCIDNATPEYRRVVEAELVLDAAYDLFQLPDPFETAPRCPTCGRTWDK